MELKLDPKWKFATQDKDGEIWLWKDMPIVECGRMYWIGAANNDGALGPFNADLGNWRDSLHQIIDGKLVKYVDIPGDGEKVIVGSGEYRRYSTGRLDKDGCLICYENSGDKWSSFGRTAYWDAWRRPTPEELAEE